MMRSRPLRALLYGGWAAWAYSTMPHTTLGFGQIVLTMFIGYAASVPFGND